MKSIHIIGGGIIGLTSAWYLTERGYRVTVVDKSDLSDGTSHGNAGMIVPSHFVPLAAPGVISQGIKWMFDSKSPFYVKPRLSLELVQWLWAFYRSCNPRHVARSMPVLYQFNEWSKELYRSFSEDPRFAFCFEEKGLLMLYRSAHQRDEELELAEKAHELGIRAEHVTGEALRALEPDIALNALGGIFFPGDAHLYPNRFIAELRRELAKQGCAFRSGFEVKDFVASGGSITELEATDGRRETVDQLILCGGSWTPLLLKKLGVKMLLQDGKGYSFTLKDAPVRPRIPTILTEAKVAVTPMGNDLRIGGTLELGGMSTRVNASRLQGIVESIPRYYPELEIGERDLERIWLGYRPCSPDGMPYLGRPAGVANLVVATGHGMMGMSMGPATGKLVSQIIAGEETTMSIKPFALNR